MHYVYIIQSQKDNSHYTGATDDLQKRLENHNWHTVKSTSAKTPFELSWYCAFKDKKKAYEFEKYLKTGSGIAFSRKHLI